MAAANHPELVAYAKFTKFYKQQMLDSDSCQCLVALKQYIMRDMTGQAFMQNNKHFNTFVLNLYGTSSSKSTLFNALLEVFDRQTLSKRIAQFLIELLNAFDV